MDRTHHVAGGTDGAGPPDAATPGTTAATCPARSGCTWPTGRPPGVPPAVRRDRRQRLHRIQARVGLRCERAQRIRRCRTPRGGRAQVSDWSPASPRGARQLVEVVLDQLVLSGMSLMADGPHRLHPPPSGYAAAAQELSALGVDGAHAEPPPLHVRTLRRRRIGRLAYERLTFDHDPLLPHVACGRTPFGPGHRRGLPAPARGRAHGRGWCGCMAPARASRSTCCFLVPAGCTTTGIQCRSCRSSRGTAFAATRGRRIPTANRWPTSPA